MNKNNPICDVHMYPKKTKCRISIFAIIIFGGRNVLSPESWLQLSRFKV